MITACFARVLQRCTSRRCAHFLLTFQEVIPISKTRNQLIGICPLREGREGGLHTLKRVLNVMICQEHTSASPAVTPHEAIAGVASSYSTSCAARLVAQAHPAALAPQPLPRESLRLRQ